MTAKELAELILSLDEYEQNLTIGFAFPSADYWGRIKVEEIENPAVEHVQYSTYHRSMVLVDPEDFNEETEEWLVLQ